MLLRGRQIFASLLILVPRLGTTSNVFAQSTAPADLPPNASDQVDQTLFSPSPALPSPAEVPFSEDPQPTLKIPDPPVVETPASSSTLTFAIQKVELLGSTVLQPELAELLAQWENKQNVTFEQLLNLRSAIADLYIQHGYVTSGAFLPSHQNLSSGIIQIQVVEGELEELRITGLKRLKKSYIRDRLRPATTPPLNQQRLEKAFQLLQQDPLIQQIHAELTAGTVPGRSRLLVDIKRAPAFHVSVGIDNHRAPSIGTVQGTVDVAHDNVLGLGDHFQGRYSLTGGLNLFDVSYRIPFNPKDGTLGLRYSNSDSEIIASDFREFDIKSDSQNFSINLRQPILKNPNREVALGLGFDIRNSQTFINQDIPFSFSLGPDDGKSKVRALRFSQEWVDQRRARVLAARSQLSVGLNALDATVNPQGPSGEFVSWLGQFQWVQKLSTRNLVISRINAQLSPDALLPVEKISMGGIHSIRGYAQNQSLADNGVMGSVELRFPVLKDEKVLQLTPFLEGGTLWNNFEANPSPSVLVGIGVGMRGEVLDGVHYRLDFGIPLTSVPDRGNSLQEAGVLFSIRYQPL